jgi:hypothetical protein
MKKVLPVRTYFHRARLFGYIMAVTILILLGYVLLASLGIILS